MEKERYRGFRVHCHLKSSDSDSHSTSVGAGPKYHCQLGRSLYPPDQWFSASSDFCPLPRTCQSLEMYLICLLVLFVKVGKEELGRNSILKSGFGDLSKYL